MIKRVPIIIAGAAALVIGCICYQQHSPSSVVSTLTPKSAGQIVKAEVTHARPTATVSLEKRPRLSETAEPSEIKLLLQQLATIKAQPESSARKDHTLDLLCQLAVQKGERAIQELFAAEDEPFRRQVFGYLLSVWADSAPLAALQWYHDPARDDLASTGYSAPPDFYEKSFRQLASQDPRSAAGSLPAVADAASRLRAVSAMISFGRERGQLPAMLDALGSAGEPRPVEMALINKFVGDDIGYGEWRAKITDPQELKLLHQELGLEVANLPK